MKESWRTVVPGLGLNLQTVVKYFQIWKYSHLSLGLRLSQSLCRLQLSLGLSSHVGLK